MGAFAQRLARPLADTDVDATRVDLIAALESLKSAAAAAQARVTVEFDRSQRNEQAAAGVRATERGKGVAAQVALARKDSPVKGRRHVGLAKALVHEMPHTLVALSAGRLSEWRATLMVRETACLSAEHRAEVDERLAGTPGRLDGLGDQGVAREARRLAQLLDPGAAVRRARRAKAERCVTLRPAPDTMSYLSGLLPVEQGVAVLAALTKHAASLTARGDRRSKGQIMADTLVERITGQAVAEAVPVEVHLVMTDKSLFGGDADPAHLVGHGPLPSGVARDIIRGRVQQTDEAQQSVEDPQSFADRAKAWIRRLYTSPSGDLVAMETHRREVPEGLKRFIVARDQFCRTPWCDAPIRHGDHVRRAADGGETSAANLQGKCEACNYAKESYGWSSTPARGRSSTDEVAPDVVIETPTGHHYTSRPPVAPGAEDLKEAESTSDISSAA